MDKVKETLQKIADGYIAMGYVAGVIQKPDNSLHIYLEDKIAGSEVYVSGVQYKITDEASIDKFITAAGRLLRDRRVKIHSYHHLLKSLITEIDKMETREQIIKALAVYKEAVETELKEKYLDFDKLVGDNGHEEE